MNRQEIFDKVITHLVTQKVQSRTNSDWGGCAYRGENGLSCAVGCLISDEDYRPEMDDSDVIEMGTDIGAILNVFPHLPEWMRLNRDLLSDLQGIHDTDYDTAFSFSDDDFREDVIHVANAHNLKVEHLINASTVSGDTV